MDDKVILSEIDMQAPALFKKEMAHAFISMSKRNWEKGQDRWGCDMLAHPH